MRVLFINWSSLVKSTSLAVLAITLTSCAAGPTSRTVEGQWQVSKNICTSNPAKPDLGDMRSEIRTKISGIGGERIITVGHLEKTILVSETKVTGRSSVGVLSSYENSASNALLETQDIRNQKELNKIFRQTIEDFFKDDPSIDGKEAVSFCLFRGQ